MTSPAETSADFIHGGALDSVARAFPDAPKPWIDLSTGINPWPYPVASLPEEAFRHLPMEADRRACARAMADAWSTQAGKVEPVPGTEMVIRHLPRLLGGTTAMVARPTYGDYGLAWQAAGHRVLDVEDPLVAGEEADVIVLCNPNNPDGRRWSPEAIEKARQTQAARGGWIVVDEAYGDLDPGLSCVPRAGAEGLIVMRSFGKFFGLAGVRLGAVLAPDQIIDQLRLQLGTWPVSGPALRLGAAAYGNAVWIRETRQRLGKARADLDALLAESGVTVTGGTDLFRFVDVPDAYAVWRHLAESGIYTRRFAYTDRHLRVGLPSGVEERERLAVALSGL